MEETHSNDGEETVPMLLKNESIELEAESEPVCTSIMA